MEIIMESAETGRDSAHWYVIQVFTGEENHTVDMCKIIVSSSKEHEFFIPETDRRKRYYGKWHNIRKPMFPGYVFISSENIDELYEELKRVPKLTKLLKTGETIIPISSGEEMLIKRLTDSEYIAHMSLGYIEGDKLVIEEGPLVGMEAMVKHIDRHKRTAILTVDMFGSPQDITMGLEILRKV